MKKIDDKKTNSKYSAVMFCLIRKIFKMVARTKLTKTIGIVADTGSQANEINRMFQGVHTYVQTSLEAYPVDVAVSVDRLGAFNGKIVDSSGREYLLGTIQWSKVKDANDVLALMVDFSVRAHATHPQNQSLFKLTDGKTLVSRQGRFRKTLWSDAIGLLDIVTAIKMAMVDGVQESDAMGYFGYSIELTSQGKKFLATLNPNLDLFFSYKETADDTKAKTSEKVVYEITCKDCAWVGTNPTSKAHVHEEGKIIKKFNAIITIKV